MEKPQLNVLRKHSLCGGWLETGNKTISVQFNLTGTATGTELGNIQHDLMPQKNNLVELII